MSTDHKWFSHAWHHLQVAVVVAAALSILHHTHLLGWLDSMMLRVVSNTRVASVDEVVRPDATTPAVLLIGNGLYETEFAQHSPLDRDKLALLIGHIARAEPSLLAIDIDLSPGPGQATGDALDQVLLAVLQKRQTRLVLVVPFAVQTGELLRTKYQWMKQLCAQGARFGEADVHQTQGVILRHVPDQPTLGSVAHLWDDNPVCAQIARSAEVPMFLSQTGVPSSAGDDFFRQEPFNARYFLSESTVVTSLQSLTDIPAGLKGRPVFLGGGYGNKDRYLTAFGMHHGVVVHAAAYFSGQAEHRVTPGAKVLALVIDVLVGTVAGFLFHWSWCRYRCAATRLHSVGAEGRLVRYLAARSWLVGNFLALGGMIVGIVGMGSLAYGMNYWIDPGPMVLGVFIKTLLASYIRPQPAYPPDGVPTRELICNGEHAPAFVRRLDSIFWIGIVLWAAYDLAPSLHGAAH